MAAILNFQNGRLSIYNFTHISAVDRHRVMILVSIPTFLGGKEHIGNNKNTIHVIITPFR